MISAGLCSFFGFRLRRAVVFQFSGFYCASEEFESEVPTPGGPFSRWLRGFPNE